MPGYQNFQNIARMKVLVLRLQRARQVKPVACRRLLKLEQQQEALPHHHGRLRQPALYLIPDSKAKLKDFHRHRLVHLLLLQATIVPHNHKAMHLYSSRIMEVPPSKGRKRHRVLLLL